MKTCAHIVYTYVYSYEEPVITTKCFLFDISNHDYRLSLLAVINQIRSRSISARSEIHLTTHNV